MRYFFPLLSICVCLALYVPTAAQQQQDNKLRVDAYGDSLPDGAVARLGTVRWRHEGEIYKAVFSPDGKKIASASGDARGSKFVYLWDENGKNLWRNSTSGKTANEIVMCLVFSPDGSNVVAGIGTQRSNELGALFAATNRACRLFMFDTETGKNRTEWKEQDKPMLAAAFADNGKTLVCIDENGKFRAWDVASQKLVREWQAVEFGQNANVKGTSPSLLSAAIAPAGDRLAVQITEVDAGKSKNELRILDVSNSKEIFRTELGGGVATKTLTNRADAQMVFSADGNTIAVGDGKGIALRDANTGKIEAEFRDPKPYGISFSANGKVFALDNSSGKLGQAGAGTTVFLGSTSTITIHDATTRKVIKEIKGGPASAIKLVNALSPDGRYVLTRSAISTPKVGIISMVDTQTGQERYASVGHGGSIESLSFSQDGNNLYVHENRRLFTWERKDWSLKDSIRSSEAAKQMPAGDGTLSLGSADYSHFLVQSLDKQFEVRERTTGKIISTLEPPPQDKDRFFAYRNSFFSPSNGFVVVSIGALKGPDIFNVRTGKHWLRTDDNRKWRVAFSPDDKRLAVAESSGEIIVYDTASGKKQHRFERAGMGKVSRVGAMAFSPDGHYLASWGDQDGPICIWSLQTGKRIHEIPGKSQAKPTLTTVADSEFALVFSPDSRLLASTHREDRSITQIWETATGKLRQEFKGHIGSVGALAWSPDGRLLASGSADTTVLVWDVWGSEKR